MKYTLEDLLASSLIPEAKLVFIEMVRRAGGSATVKELGDACFLTKDEVIHAAGALQRADLLRYMKQTQEVVFHTGSPWIRMLERFGSTNLELLDAKNEIARLKTVIDHKARPKPEELIPIAEKQEEPKPKRRKKPFTKRKDWLEKQAKEAANAQ